MIYGCVIPDFEFALSLDSKGIGEAIWRNKQFECQKIIQIKRLPVGTYLFNVTVQLITFEDAHGPPNDLVTITFNNETSQDWHAIDFKRKRLKENEIPKLCN